MDLPVTHNHLGYQTRLDFVRHEICSHFGFENPEISPLAYDIHCPFKYNNFVYLITLPSGYRSDGPLDNQPLRPGCVKIPDGITEFILRLSNSDAEGVNKSNRVENEVGIMNLASKALAHIVPRIIPSVYGWATASLEHSQGWILEEFMQGINVDMTFNELSLTQKQDILDQMAGIVKSLQIYRLPATITGFGGVTFNSHGEIVSGAMTTVDGGPWSSLKASFKGKMQLALGLADKNPHIQGWRANGVRERLDTFITHGLEALSSKMESGQEKVIVHSDLTTNNLLFDPATNRITALLDYDFAFISNPFLEFLRSFHTNGGLFPGGVDPGNEEQLALRQAQLHGFPVPLPQSSSPDAVQWEVAKAWDDALTKAGALRPSTIHGLELLADIDALSEAILPFHVTNPDMISLQSEEDVKKKRDEGEKRLDGILNHLGF